ncbi:MAG TPA: hypothetical protein VGH79_10675 [Gaiellaceae bacterium]|jgi:hypothetical protein
MTDSVTAPDFVEPVEAWRVWRVCEREGRRTLQSAYADAAWEPGVALSAACSRTHRPALRPWRTETSCHDAPDLACSCGIYGVRSFAAARWYLESQTLFDRVDRVIGRVALWGDVVVSEGGWRASYAYPIELFVPVRARGLWRRTPSELDDVFEALERYDVPVDVYRPNVVLAA